MVAIIKNNNAVTPVLGAVLLVLLTVVLAGAVAVIVFSNGSGLSLSSSTPVAMIEVNDVVGYASSYKNNFVSLEHKGGDPLDLDSTFIVLSGEGSSYVGKVCGGGSLAYGHVTVKYFDLTPEGSLLAYKRNNPCIEDGLWSAGEILVLDGDDSINGTDASNVHVSVDGYSDTSNNYGFNDGETVTVKIFDSLTNRVICEDTVKVKLSE